MMGRIRDAIEARRPRDVARRPSFGPPASTVAIATAEELLGLRIPSPLRDLYEEFDGLWFGEPRGLPFHTDENVCYYVLPLQHLPAARDILVDLYGREEGREDFEGNLRRCIAFALTEGGASFKFLTDHDAWDIEPRRVGQWDHDGGPSDWDGPLIEFLAERCRSMSRM